VRSIRARTLPDCALTDVATLELEALDDGPSHPTSFAEVTKDRAVELPSLPIGAHAFVVRGRNTEGASLALGILEVKDGAANGAIFREAAACTLPSSDAAEKDLSRMPALVRPAVGASEDGALLAGGLDDENHARADAVFVDAHTLESTRLRDGLLRFRGHATVLPLQKAFVVAGGESDGKIWDDAERLDAHVIPLAFDRSNLVKLSAPRTEAGGIVMASGAGLLVGGRGEKGALDTLEIIDGERLVSRVTGLGRLRVARRLPKVVRFSSGEIAVLGGIDDKGAPLPDIDLFDAQAADSRKVDLAAKEWTDAVALPSGVVLVVRGARGSASFSLSLLHVDGTIDSLPDVVAGTKAPRLLGATDGSPFLFDGTWRRYDLWDASVASAESPPSALSPVDTVDPFPLGVGVFGVLREADRGFVTVVASRYDTRNELTDDTELGLGSTAHLVPDRFASGTATAKGLDLAKGMRVAIADTSYAGVTLELDLRDGGPPPLVELRGLDGTLIALVGSGPCAYPSGAPTSVVLERAADGSLQIRFTPASIGPISCKPLLGTARVRLTVIGPEGGTHLRSLRATRA